LKQFATIKKEVAQGKQRRPDTSFIVPDEVMAVSIKPIPAEQPPATSSEETKQSTSTVHVKFAEPEILERHEPEHHPAHIS
jgi:hypothetical protein